jgi:predicted amidohydrolase
MLDERAFPFLRHETGDQRAGHSRRRCPTKLELVPYGSSEIVDPDGMVVQSARQLSEDVIVAEIATVPRRLRSGWDAARNRAVMDEYATYVAASAATERT